MLFLIISIKGYFKNQIFIIVKMDYDFIDQKITEQKVIKISSMKLLLVPTYSF